MANIQVRRGEGGETAMERRREASPFRLMRDLLGWDPFAEMLPGWLEEERPRFLPDFDVKETENAFQFTADLPGIDPKDVDIKVTDNRLTVEGKREEEKEEKGETVYRRERSYGSFQRTFTLPAGVDADQIGAELKNGVLTLTVPKKPEAKPKQVTVKAA